MPLNPAEYAAKTGNEFAHQNALFMWCNMAGKFGLQAADDPLSYSVAGHAQSNYGHKPNSGVVQVGGPEAIAELNWLYAIKNQGHGDVIRGARSAQEGVKPGVPDMFLPIPRMQDIGIGNPVVAHCGLYIELKRPVSVGKRAGVEEQIQTYWREHLRRVGYAAEVCYGWEEARSCLLGYLGIFEPKT